MKNLHLLSLLVLLSYSATAQRKLDIQITLTQPSTDSILVEKDGMVNVSAIVKNNGNDTLYMSDTLALYMTENGNPILFFDGMKLDTFIFFNFDLDPGETATTNFPSIGISYPPGHYTTCLGIKMYSQSPLVADTLLTNNEDCVDMQVVPVSVDNVGSNNKIKVYPNPANDLLHIEGVQSTNKITIYNILGKMALQTKINNNTINIERLTPGNYYLDIDGMHLQFIKQ